MELLQKIYRRRRPYRFSEPIIPVFLGRSVRVYAFIDSGCNCSVLDRHYIAAVGLSEDDVEKAPKEPVEDIGGTTYAPVFTIEVGVGNKWFKCPATIVDKHPYSELGTALILGREKVFEELGPITFYEFEQGSYVFLGADGIVSPEKD